MKTAIKGIDVKKAVEIAKPFVGNLRGKTASRPVLKAALVTPEYVMTTDSYKAIRIKHTDLIEESYLHHYKKELSGNQLATSYPSLDRLFPDPQNAQHSFIINVNEWLEAHELAKVVAKEHKNRVTTLENNQISVNYSNQTPNFQDIAFKYTLDNSTKVKVSYNCEFMINTLKAYKKAKEKDVTVYFYGKLRPMLFVAGDIEALILPVRTF